MSDFALWPSLKNYDRFRALFLRSAIKRVPEYVPGLFGKASAWRSRVIRTSNAYVISDPLASKFNVETGTTTQGFKQEKLLQIVDQTAQSHAPTPATGCGVGRALRVLSCT